MHFSVTVVVRDVRDLNGALAPFGLDGDRPTEWDSWGIGGRFHDLLRVRGSSTPVDVARRCDVDWETMDAARVVGLRKRYRFLRKGGVALGPGIRNGESKREYVERLQAPFQTYALLDLDGEWHEDDRDWFGGLSDEAADDDEREAWPERYQRLVAAAPDDALLVIVDCHF